MENSSGRFTKIINLHILSSLQLGCAERSINHILAGARAHSRLPRARARRRARIFRRSGRGEKVRPGGVISRRGGRTGKSGQAARLRMRARAQTRPPRGAEGCLLFPASPSDFPASPRRRIAFAQGPPGRGRCDKWPRIAAPLLRFPSRRCLSKRNARRGTRMCFSRLEDKKRRLTRR